MPLTKAQLAAMLLDQLGLNEREAEDLGKSHSLWSPASP